jgi:chemotaxis protein MotB
LSEEKPHELLIIKRHRGGHEGHHGGAWKIAFADFMTAMMALFLVLWLISATSEKAKISIARYFNPVKLVDMSTMKKGVSDPNDAASVSPDPPGDGHPKRTEGGPQQEMPPDLPAKEGAHDAAPGVGREATHSEETLFRDPYAVLAEIVAAGDAIQVAPNKTMADKEKKDNADGASDVSEMFKDPFKIVIPDVLSDTPVDPKKPVNVRPPAPEPHAPASVPNTPPPATAQLSTQTPDASVQQQAPGKVLPLPQPARNDAANSPMERSQNAASPGEVEAAKLQAEIATEIGKITGKTGNEPMIPNVEVKASDEGILISLTDRYNYSMFAIGSAEPQARTIQVMDKIAAILKKYQGRIVIRGHTDGRPYKGANYDNWRLSSARAHMAHYMLTRGGLDEKRIEKIEGYADHRLKNTKDPIADENRRIEILLRRDRT